MKLINKVQDLIKGEFPLILEFGYGNDRIKSYNDSVKKLAERIIRLIEVERIINKYLRFEEGKDRIKTYNEKGKDIVNDGNILKIKKEED